VNRKGVEHITASGCKKGNSNSWTYVEGNKKLFEAFITSSDEFQPCINDLE
jgi:hypothetical protein